MVADLPTTSTLISSFSRVQQKERELGHENRAQMGADLMAFLRDLEQNWIRGPLSKMGYGYAGSEEFNSNLEAILTWIDLHLQSQLRLRVSNSQGQESEMLTGLFGAEAKPALLDEFRRNLETYLSLVLLEPASPPRDSLSSFAKSLKPGDTIITFNYDLLAELSILERGLWHPLDGYGIRFRHSNGRDTHRSQVFVFKLHGSLNWEWDALHQDVVLKTRYDDGRPVFPDLPGVSPAREDVYQGRYEPFWMLPSYVKCFEGPFRKLWQLAHSAMCKARELVVLGYSLPAADSAANLLFSVGAEAKPLTIVDGNEELTQRYETITGRPISKDRWFPNLKEYLESVT
jgi:hypothetical protein